MHADADSSFAARASPDGAGAAARLQHDGLRAERRELVGERRCDPLFRGSLDEPRVDRDDLSFDRGPHRADGLGLAHDRPTRSRFRGAHPLERGQRVDADDAVGLLADVPLELAHGSIGRADRRARPPCRRRTRGRSASVGARGRRRRGGTGRGGRACGHPAGSRPRRAGPTCRARPYRRPAGSAAPGTRGPPSAVDGPNVPSSSAASMWAPSATSRCWMSRISAPSIVEDEGAHANQSPPRPSRAATAPVGTEVRRPAAAPGAARCPSGSRPWAWRPRRAPPPCRP